MKKLIKSKTGYSYVHADRTVFDSEGVVHEYDNWVKAQVKAGILEAIDLEEEKPAKPVKPKAAPAEGK